MVLFKKVKGQLLPNWDLTFKDFKSLDELLPRMTCTFNGKYNILVRSDNYENIVSAYDTNRYDAFNLYVEVNDNLYDYILERKPKIKVLSNRNSRELFNELVADRKLLFAKGLLDDLYFALPKDNEKVIEILDELKFRYNNKEITKKDIDKVYQIEDLCWPSKVLSGFLKQHRWRWFWLGKCYEQFPREQIYYMMRKRVKELVEAKMEYYKTGNATDYVKSIPQKNLLLIYDLFLTSEIKDVYIIMYNFEGGFK